MFCAKAVSALVSYSNTRVAQLYAQDLFLNMGDPRAKERNSQGSFCGLQPLLVGLRADYPLHNIKLTCTGAKNAFLYNLQELQKWLVTQKSNPTPPNSNVV